MQLFIDTLDMDLERLQQINRTLAFIPEEVASQQRAELRTIEALVIRPSEPIAEIAAAHAHGTQSHALADGPWACSNRTARECSAICCSSAATVGT